MSIFTTQFLSLWNYSNINYVLIYCLLSAGDGNKFQTSVTEITKATGISTQSVRTCLKNLIKSSDIMIEPTNRNSEITVLKYHDYLIKNPNTCTFSSCIQAKSAHEYRLNDKRRLEQ